ncbi:endoplasmic reticulum vesicle transporter-domain-containing protein [Geopyxis carbonaria]|nr:endoplasmic reticulum vesicle transporter-domain-containing protein [Geopyxis carbonaria]
MARGSRLTRLDAFSKTVEDARVRTTSGGIVTMVSVIVVIFLVVGEFRDYRRIVVQPELVVDKGRGEQLPINLNITFPHLPCNLVTLDVMDVSGEQQTGVTHGIHLTRLSKFPESQPISTTQVDLHADTAEHLDPTYCGQCYGAPGPKEKNGCCNTCEDVREAYATNGWAFGAGEGVEQCEREHYGEHLAEMREEGCNVAGHLAVNKVIGNFHIAPGKSFSTPQMHVHDLQQYFNSPKEHTFTHIIHSMSFGPELPLDTSVESHALQAHNPLDDTRQDTKERSYNFMYFIKVVSTSFLPLGVELGQPGAIETHQYSVTSHKRSLSGGQDSEHPDTMHARGGIPGVFFSYDISPMKVINRETRQKSFVSFLTGVCAVIGGTLTVAAAIDRGVYEGGLRVRKLHQG